MNTTIYVVFHSIYGHVYRMAQAVAEGAKSVTDVEVKLFRVPETVPADVLARIGASEAQKSLETVPVIQPDQLAEADGLVFGTGTRFGNMSAQMRSFLDQTGGLWMKGALVGKPAGVFVATATQHGGQETTITSFHTTLLHHGMLVVGVPYSEQRLTAIDAVSGGSPYGAGTITGGDGRRMPSEDELVIARTQGRRVAEVARALKRGFGGVS
ncbi:MAG: NAD(P)H:quinone oxidoreductase [Myxococcales bacterium]|nr:NAD(P)H:quinone oxidoreductase [Myxococcales bacterium]